MSFLGGLFRFQNTVYHVTEDEGVVEVCITPNSDYVGSCPFPATLWLSLSTEDGSAGMWYRDGVEVCM